MPKCPPDRQCNGHRRILQEQKSKTPQKTNHAFIQLQSNKGQKGTRKLQVKSWNKALNRNYGENVHN